MTFTAQDHSMMGRALQLAAKARFTTAPNPAVGCVVVAENQIIGEGFTRPAGGNHAEIEALQMAGDASASTLYVTLEPCSHQGKTGPCVQALIKAKVARVVIACEDPNPKVSGAGIKQLQEAGIEVQLGLMEAQARELNKGFFKRFTEGTPLGTS